MADQQLIGIPIPICHYAQHFGKYGTTGLLLFEDLCDFAAVKPLYDGLSPSALRAVRNMMIKMRRKRKRKWWYYRDN
jgi:hypothetical protein